MGIFIKTQAVFKPEIDDLINNEKYIYDDFCFDLLELESFNRDEEENHVCLRFKSGFDISVALSYNSVCELLNDSPNIISINLSEN